MTDIHDAPRELLALALAMREDWDRDDTWNALLAARAAGWDFTRTVREVVRLLLREDSEPRELRHAARPPIAAPEHPGSLPGDLRAQALADCEAAAESLRHRERGPETGTWSAA